MKGKKWLILLASLALVLLASSVGVTRSSLVDPESSTGNTFQAWTSGEWVQTTQSDFEAGVLYQVVDVQMGANADDGEEDGREYGTNTWKTDGYYGDKDGYFGYYETYDSPFEPAFRFDNITCSGTVTNAYLKLYFTGGGTSTTGGYLYAIDEADPVTFSESDNTTWPSNRNITTAKVSWNQGSAAGWYESPDIKSIIQELVDSYTYTGTQAMALYWREDTHTQGTYTKFELYGHPGGHPPTLHIEYRTVDTTTSPGDVKLAEVGWGSYSSELLINPDAETGDTTGWTAEGSNTGNFAAGFDCPRGSAGPYSGSYCFFWNLPSASDDWAYQEVDLSAYLAKIQAGEAQIRAGGWLVCSEYHVPVWDIVRLKIILYDSGHTEISTIYDTGELNIQNWAEYLVEDYDLPTNAKYVRLYFQTYEPDWDAGNADDLTVKIRVKEYYASGTIASQVLDTGVAGARWDALFWDETLPSNTDITFEVRASDTLTAGFPDASWVSVGGASPITSGLPSGRYMQWRATLTTSDTSETPTLHEVRVYHY